MDTSLFLYRLSGWSQDILLIVVCFTAYKKYWFWKKHYQYFFFYLIIITLLELVYAVTALILSNNLFLDYIYITIEFILLGFFLRGVIGEFWLKKIILAVSVFFAIFQIFNAFWIEKIENFNSFGATINSFYIVALSIWSLTVIAKQNFNKNIFDLTVTWFVFGLLLNFASVLLFDYLYSLAIPYKNDELLYAILTTQNCLKSVFIGLFMVGILKIKPVKST